MAAFESINASATPESVNAWSAKEEQAQMERGHDVTVMDIYDIKMKRCESDHSAIIFAKHQLSVPSRAEILLELTEKEIGISGRKGQASWISSGLKIQEIQYDFPQLLW